MMRRRRWMWEMAAVVAFLATPAACLAAEPIKLGALLETSGFIAGLGNPGLEGARLAVDQLNAAGGINGRPVELINVNTESDETKAVTGAKRLIEQERVLAIVGPMSSGSVFAIIDTVQRARVPLMANGASRGIVLPPDQKRGVFLAPLTDVLVQGRMLDHMKKRGITKIGLLNSDVAFGTSGREQVERLAPATGIRIVMQQTAGNADQDMTPQLAKIRASDAEATVVWGTGGFIAIATKNPGSSTSRPRSTFPMLPTTSTIFASPAKRPTASIFLHRRSTWLARCPHRIRRSRLSSGSSPNMRRSTAESQRPSPGTATTQL